MEIKMKICENFYYQVQIDEKEITSQGLLRAPNCIFLNENSNNKKEEVI